MRGSPQNTCFYLHFNHKTDLTLLIKTITIKVRSLCVVLMISPLVVRRTFYLVVNDLTLIVIIIFFKNIAISYIYIISLKAIFVKGLFEKSEKYFLRFKMEFSERLKELRKQAHLTQVELASKLGIVQSSYADWERGKKKPTQENLVKIAQILNVSVDYLVGNSEERTDELDNIELLFRMNSEGLTEEEKEIFKKELIEFMEERKKAFGRKN